MSWNSFTGDVFGADMWAMTLCNAQWYDIRDHDALAKIYNTIDTKLLDQQIQILSVSCNDVNPLLGLTVEQSLERCVAGKESSCIIEEGILKATHLLSHSGEEVSVDFLGLDAQEGLLSGRRVIAKKPQPHRLWCLFVRLSARSVSFVRS